MNEIQVFNNPEFGDIRTVMIDDEPWWVGKDVAAALEYKDHINAMKTHVDTDDKRRWQITTPSGRQTMTIINESGLYSLILSSKLPSAKKFKRWITSEVLPALRKNGKYEIQKPEADQRQLTVDDYIRVAHIVASCRNERMPIVLALIEKSGIEIPNIKAIQNKAKIVEDRDEDGETAALINRAINEYGIKQARIAALCGLHPTQITRIRSGQQNPSKTRARIIQEAINTEISKIK